MLLLINVACLIVLRLDMLRARARMFEVMQSRIAAIIIAAFADMGVGTISDVLVGLGFYTRTRTRRYTFGSLRATERSTNLNVRSYSSSVV